MREGVNSLLMKFSEDIKLEGVMNTSEDNKGVQRDLGQSTLAGNCECGVGGRGAGRHVGLPKEPGGGESILGASMKLGFATASLDSGQTGKPFPTSQIEGLASQ